MAGPSGQAPLAVKRDGHRCIRTLPLLVDGADWTFPAG